MFKKAHPIYLRITVDGNRTEITTRQSTEEDRWDSRNGAVKGNKEDARVINNHVDNPKKHWHIIADNLNVHKHHKVKEWVSAKKRVTMHFTPT